MSCSCFVYVLFRIDRQMFVILILRTFNCKSNQKICYDNTNKNKKNALLEQTKNVSKNKPLAKENFYKTFLTNINSVTKDEVMQASKSFVQADNSQIIITGKVGNILDKIENIYINDKQIPVSYYDAFGKIIDRPDYSVDESVSVESVISNYIDIIGGRDRLQKVESIDHRYKFYIPR